MKTNISMNTKASHLDVVVVGNIGYAILRYFRRTVLVCCVLFKHEIQRYMKYKNKNKNK